MIVNKIFLKNFRNYKSEEIEFDKKINIIHGNNAQGKTNILEAIYLFALGKSNRAFHDYDVINFEEEESEIKIDFISREKENTGEIYISKNKKKKISINEIPIKKNSDLVGRFNVVFFGPEYLSLIKEGPKKRRKNIDILISQLKKGYLSDISEYKKITDQKNVFLKDEKQDKVLLSVLNDKIIDLSLRIIKNRFEYVKKIEEIAKKIQLEISEGKENLEIDYISCGIKIENLDNLKEVIEKKAKIMFEKEKKYKECIFGPHRDDFEFKINGLNLKLFGSQGQQKTAILVQKIAEVELFKEETGEFPVLLLDDIMSELDKERQNYVINKIKNMQIFITCTDAESLKNIKSGKFIKIEKGMVKECICI